MVVELRYSNLVTSSLWEREFKLKRKNGKIEIKKPLSIAPASLQKYHRKFGRLQTHKMYLR